MLKHTGRYAFQHARKHRWYFSRIDDTYVFKHALGHIYVLKQIGRHGCVHIHQKTFVLKKKSETTYVFTHVLLNTENTNVLKHIRRRKCSNTPEDTDLLK